MKPNPKINTSQGNPQHDDTEHGPWWERPFGYARSAFPALRSLVYAAKGSLKVARPLAYSSEVGESTKPVISKGLYRTLWGLSIGYVGFDTASHMHDLSEQQGCTNQLMVKSAADNLIWHTGASLVAPALAIKGVVTVAKKTIKAAITKPNPRLIQICPPLLGLVSIPLIVHPIDHFADWIMDNGLRPYLYNEEEAVIVQEVRNNAHNHSHNNDNDNSDDEHES